MRCHLGLWNSIAVDRCLCSGEPLFQHELNGNRCGRAICLQLPKWADKLASGTAASVGFAALKRELLWGATSWA